MGSRVFVALALIGVLLVSSSAEEINLPDGDPYAEDIPLGDSTQKIAEEQPILDSQGVQAEPAAAEKGTALEDAQNSAPPVQSEPEPIAFSPSVDYSSEPLQEPAQPAQELVQEATEEPAQEPVQQPAAPEPTERVSEVEASRRHLLQSNSGQSQQNNAKQFNPEDIRHTPAPPEIVRPGGYWHSVRHSRYAHTFGNQ